MTFKDLKENSVEYADAYIDWCSVIDAKKMGVIPDDFAPYVPDYCRCGSEFIVKMTLTQLMCCDPNCSLKEGYKIAKIFSDFGIVGVGAETCKFITTQLKEHNKDLMELGYSGFLTGESYLEILTVPWDKYPVSCQTVAGSKFSNGAEKILRTKLTFPELLGKLGIKGIGGNSEKLFAGLDSWEELETEIKNMGGIQKFCATRGCYSYDIIHSISNSLNDIKFASKIFKSSIRSAGLYEIPICITGSIKLCGKSLKKKDFITLCNETLKLKNGQQLFEIKMNGAVESNAFILYSTPSQSSKFITGKRRGQVTDGFGTHDVLMTVDDFYNLMRKTLNQVEQRLEEEAHSNE